MNVWTDIGDEWEPEPFIRSKQPTIITLIDGDEISIRARNKNKYTEIELTQSDLFRLFKETLKSNILTYEQEQKLLKLMQP